PRCALFPYTTLFRSRMQVAVDTTPLLGPRTGVAQAVHGLLGALPAAAPDVEVRHWELTRRSMPVPPRVLLRLWARTDRPRADHRSEEHTSELQSPCN